MNKPDKMDVEDLRQPETGQLELSEIKSELQPLDLRNPPDSDLELIALD